jgi:hypothetical protein
MQSTLIYKEHLGLALCLARVVSLCLKSNDIKITHSHAGVCQGGLRMHSQLKVTASRLTDSDNGLKPLHDNQAVDSKTILPAQVDSAPHPTLLASINFPTKLSASCS